eukprot:8566185-Alexandrium_andersonii.AAC.1
METPKKKLPTKLEGSPSTGSAASAGPRSMYYRSADAAGAIKDIPNVNADHLMRVDTALDAIVQHPKMIGAPSADPLGIDSGHGSQAGTS